jgi:O-glycosyl hydrolase
VLPALLFMSAALVQAAAAAEQVFELRLNPEAQHQTIEGWGTCLIFWDLANTPYQSPAWRKAFREAGCNILRIDMKKDVLVASGGHLADPVTLSDDLDANVKLMNFDNPKAAVFGRMAFWLSKNALEPERVRIVGSVWSPPHWMKGPTGNRQSWVGPGGEAKRPTPWLSNERDGDSIGGRLLQTPENLRQFARYLAAWVTGFERRFGTPIHALSIQNEITFENPFDSCTYELGPNGETGQHWQYAAALKAVTDEFTRLHLTAKFKGPHMAQIGPTPQNPWGLMHQLAFIKAVKDFKDDPRLIDQLDFYNCNDYMAVSEDAVKAWAGYHHGKKSVPAEWAHWLEVPGVRGDGKPIWISEAGGESADWLNDGKPSGAAVAVALKMLNALVFADAAAYIYWQMSDTSPQVSSHVLLGTRHFQTPTESYKYCAFKQVARHIRPGARRLDALLAVPGSTRAAGVPSILGRSPYDTEHGLSVAAFHHAQDRTLTLLVFNLTDQSHVLQWTEPAALPTAQLAVYRTSPTEKYVQAEPVRPEAGRCTYTAPPMSVSTLTGTVGQAGP